MKILNLALLVMGVVFLLYGIGVMLRDKGGDNRGVVGYLIALGGGVLFAIGLTTGG